MRMLPVCLLYGIVWAVPEYCFITASVTIDSEGYFKVSDDFVSLQYVLRSQRLLHLHVRSVLTIAMLTGKWVRCSKMKSDAFFLFFVFLYTVILIEPYVGMHDISGTRASHLTSASLDNVYVYIHELDTYN